VVKIILDPPATTLLSQFVLNAERSAADTILHQNIDELGDEESLILSYRQKKNRALRLISLQTAAFLDWDLDLLSKYSVYN
jgi:hypothetical protein